MRGGLFAKPWGVRECGCDGGGERRRSDGGGGGGGVCVRERDGRGGERSGEMEKEEGVYHFKF